MQGLRPERKNSEVQFYSLDRRSRTLPLPWKEAHDEYRRKVSIATVPLNRIMFVFFLFDGPTIEMLIICKYIKGYFNIFVLFGRVVISLALSQYSLSMLH